MLSETGIGFVDGLLTMSDEMPKAGGANYVPATGLPTFRLSSSDDGTGDIIRDERRGEHCCQLFKGNGKG